MKHHFFLFLTVLLSVMIESTISAQNKRIVINGTDIYYDNDPVYVYCNTSFTVKCQVLQNGNWLYTEVDYVSNMPSGWSYSYNEINGVYRESATITTNQNGGTFNVTPVFYNTMTFYGKTSPKLSFVSSPGLYGSYQSGTYEVQVDNLFSIYTDATWVTTGGARVNGSTSYTGGTSQTITTTSWGGKLKVKSNSTCGGSSDWLEIIVGTPYITDKIVNGSPSQSMNYVNGGAYLHLYTDNTATGADWTIDAGSGSISPYGTSCHAYPSPFMRLQATATNTYGSGESYMFYIQDNGYSGYRMASSNPTKSGDKVRIEFPDAKYADDLVESVALYSEKEKVIWSLSKEEAKTGKFFKDKNFVEIETGKLNKGVYYLHIQIADKKYVERLGIE